MKSKLKVQRRTCYLLFQFLLFQFLLVHFSTSGAAQSVPTSVWDGAYTEAQAKRGEVIYYERCGACHGPQLEGGDMTPALLGGVFTSTWNDLPLSDLFERIRITMPLNQPSTLSRQQTADVTAFLLQSNKWPAGQTELPRELEPLKEIQIQAIKP